MSDVDINDEVAWLRKCVKRLASRLNEPLPDRPNPPPRGTECAHSSDGRHHFDSHMIGGGCTACGMSQAGIMAPRIGRT